MNTYKSTLRSRYHLRLATAVCGTRLQPSVNSVGSSSHLTPSWAKQEAVGLQQALVLK